MWRITGIMACCLLGTCIFAGNRADINADQNVDAADLAALSNILAGNLDVAAYDLENVVVVAETGGDFDDPCDAADWVVSQNPSASKRYVILVTPGYYDLDRTLVVPEYTTIKGYGTNLSNLTRWANGVGGAVVKFEGPQAYQMRIAGLDIYNGGNSSAGPVIGVLVQDCRPEIIDCHIRAQNSSGLHDPIAIRVSRSSESTDLNIKNCEITGVSSSNGSGVPTAIEIYDSTVHAYDCMMWAFQHSDLEYAYMVTLERSSVTPTLYAYRCNLSASADAGYEYYLFRFGAFGVARFYNCQFDNEDATNVSTGGDLKFAYCFDTFCDPFP